jgi:hypothetical protein
MKPLRPTTGGPLPASQRAGCLLIPLVEYLSRIRDYYCTTRVASPCSWTTTVTTPSFTGFSGRHKATPGSAPTRSTFLPVSLCEYQTVRVAPVCHPQPINGHPAHLEGTPEFRVFPYENASLEPFEAAVSALNPLVAVKVRNAAVHAALAET